MIHPSVKFGVGARSFDAANVEAKARDLCSAYRGRSDLENLSDNDREYWLRWARIALGQPDPCQKCGRFRAPSDSCACEYEPLSQPVLKVRASAVFTPDHALFEAWDDTGARWHDLTPRQVDDVARQLGARVEYVRSC